MGLGADGRPPRPELDLHFQRSYWRADDDLVFAHPLTGHVLDASKLRKRFCNARRKVGG